MDRLFFMRILASQLKKAGFVDEASNLLIVYIIFTPWILRSKFTIVF